LVGEKVLKVCFNYTDRESFWKAFKKKAYDVRYFVYSCSKVQFLVVNSSFVELHTLKCPSSLEVKRIVKELDQLKKEFPFIKRINVWECEIGLL